VTWTLWIGSALGLLSLVVVALYQVEGRRIDRLVPYLKLFEGDSSRADAARWYRRIRHPLSLIVQLGLLALLATTLVMREPRQVAGRPVIWLVDVGIDASERGAPSGAPTRRTLLTGKVLQRVDELREGTPVSLIAAGGAPELLVGPTEDKVKLQHAASQLEAQDASANLGAGLMLARRLGYPSRADVVFFGDQHSLGGLLSETESRHLRVDSIPTQGATSGLSIQSFAARRYPLGAGQFEVILSVRSADPGPVMVRATLSAAALPGAEESPLEVAQFLAQPGKETTHTFARVSGARDAIVCKVERVDGAFERLLRDNVARAVLPREPRVRVLVVGEESLFLTAALLATANVEVEHIAAADYPPPEDLPEPWALTIFRQVAPARAQKGGAFLFLGSTGPGLPVKEGPAQRMFGIDEADRRHRLFRFFDPYDTQVLSGHSLVPGPLDRTLARTGSRPLVVEGEREEGPFISVGFAPEDSDMILRSAFPLLIRGVLEELVAGESSEWLVPGRAGETAILRTDEAPGRTFELVGPLGERRVQRRSVSPRGGRVTWTFSKAGFYELRGNDELPPQFIAVNASSGERHDVQGESHRLRTASLSATPRQRPRWFWLGAGLLGLILVEYYAFYRKWLV
jgi:hypothetical protein